MILLEAISYTYPWSGVTTLGESTGLVNTFYNISLALVGVAAFGVIVYGGILYTISAGNPSKQQDAIEWITGAVYGVVLLFGAYFILNTINPELVKLTDPKIEAVTFTTSTEGGSSIDCTKYTASECYGYSEACDYKSQDSYTSDPTKAQPESCTNKATDGINYASGISVQSLDVSSSLQSLMDCVAGKLNGTVDTISSISDADDKDYDGDSNKTESLFNVCSSSFNNPPCEHSQGSCHYGGTCKDKSYAVDYDYAEEYGSYIISAATECGANYIKDESNHIHVSVGKNCGCN